MKVAFVSTFDSFLRAGKMLADQLSSRGFECSHFVLKTRLDQITVPQIEGILNQDPYAIYDWDELFKSLSDDSFDWVVLSAENTTARRFFVRKRSVERFPRVAAIYPGLIFRHHCDGFSARMPADLVILNSSHDQQLYRALRSSYGLAGDNSFLMGPLTALGASHFTRSEKAKSVVFFDQPSVPATSEEKYYLFQRLAELAGKFSDYEFYVKLRVNELEATLHKGGQSAFEVLKRSNENLPQGGKKVGLISGSAREVLSTCALALSISSTALIEALACGCNAVSISDFGIDEEYGTAFFVGSRILRNLSECDPRVGYEPDSAWLKSHMENPDDRLEVLVAEMKNRPGSQRMKHYPSYGSEEFWHYALSSFGPRRALSRMYRRPSSCFRIRYAAEFLKRRARCVFKEVIQWVRRRN